MARSKVESWLQEMEREAAIPEPMGAEATVTLVPSGDEALAVLWAPQPSDLAQKTSVEDILVAQGKLEREKLLQARSVLVNNMVMQPGTKLKYLVVDEIQPQAVVFTYIEDAEPGAKEPPAQHKWALTAQGPEKR